LQNILQYNHKYQKGKRMQAIGFPILKQPWTYIDGTDIFPADMESKKVT